ncbi:hypothetical protein QUB80_15265 [Chlorogloeopsis sp. ULAP01]|uniref:hypothetical protein n=1 Tax=Chlorogloeopsis sp. ULAP01 TaxID=3056483 RepID=UPI0025AA3896|nr:hypothetical protein [Chlorogloeopsis sp. ULAP01]MDM9382060.1 hypothetical protein [Chlorogloeopsis sp. ULAP01]
MTEPNDDEGMHKWKVLYQFKICLEKLSQLRGRVSRLEQTGVAQRGEPPSGFTSPLRRETPPGSAVHSAAEPHVWLHSPPTGLDSPHATFRKIQNEESYTSQGFGSWYLSHSLFKLVLLWGLRMPKEVPFKMATYSRITN